MERYLIVATAAGACICRRSGDEWQVVRRGLENERLTGVIAREGVILAGGVNGVFRSDDLGESWRPASEGLDTRHVRWMAFHPDISDYELVGAEPAAIYVSRDGAASWHSIPEVPGLRDQYNWYLPYSPEAGCVRGFAIQGSRMYAAVEVGGVLVSQDGGEHWRLAGGSSGRPALGSPPDGEVHPDVHSIEVHPSSPERVFAPTGGGFYASQDGGRAWSALYPDCYCRAVWVDPADARTLILGPADGVEYRGRIEISRDGGETWALASDGLAAPWREHMVERFYPLDEELLGVLSNGELIAAPLSSLAWKPILPGLPPAAAIFALDQ
jgi:hypothetical protein